MEVHDKLYPSEDTVAGSPVVQARAEAVRCEAEELFGRRPEWSEFYREILSLRGVARRYFPTPEAMAAFERSEQYQEILRMLTVLRATGPQEERSQEPTKVITVRLPKSLHETLRVEAFERRTSMNKLCISKLLQIIEDEYVPEELH